MKERLFAFAIVSLFLFSSCSLFLSEKDSSPNILGGELDILKSGETRADTIQVDRQQRDEEQGNLGGSWYDGLSDDFVVEWKKNVTQKDGNIFLPGNRSITSWHYDGWSGRREINVRNPSGQYLTDYQVDLTVPFIQGMQPDFDDLRFTRYDDVNGTEEALPYWIESSVNGIGANVWLNVTEIHPGESNTLFAYYGNPVVQNESNGDATFLFFDDFSGTAVNTSRWSSPITDSVRAYSIGGGRLFIHIFNTYSGTQACDKKDPIALENRIIETRQRLEMGGGSAGNALVGCLGVQVYEKDAAWSRMIGRDRKENCWLKYSPSNDRGDTVWKQGAWNGAITPYHVLGVAKDGNTMDLYEDSVHLATIQDTGITEDVYRIRILDRVWGYSGNGFGRIWTDWFRIRQHVAPEPILSLIPFEGAIYSKIITLPDSMKWDMLSLDKAEPRNTHLNITVINADTNATIAGYDNLTGRNIEISELNDLGVANIRLQGWLTGNRSATPTLDSWGVEWVAGNAWRDSFIGDGKLDRRPEADEHTAALWHFDEGNGNALNDCSGNVNHGTVSGATWDDGRSGGGLEFDGENDYVQVNEAEVLGTLDLHAFTLEAWINPRMTSSHQFIVCKRHREDTDSNYQLSLWKESGHFYPKVLFGSGPGSFKATSEKPIELNRWTHIAGTYDGSMLRIFQDGKFQKEVDCPSNPFPYKSNDDVFIGAYSIEETPWLNDFLFDGMMDEVRISNIARSPEEIRRSALLDLNISGGQVQLPDNALLPGPGMVGLWNFDEGGGSITHDRTGNGNDGLLQNMGDNWWSGRFGTSLEFDGIDDYCQTTDFNISSDSMTISSWVFQPVVGAETNDVIAAKWKADSHQRSYFLCLSPNDNGNGNIAFGISDRGNNWAIYSTFNGLIRPNTWHHVVVVYNRGDFNIYLDGINQAIQSIASSVPAPSGSVFSSNAVSWLGGAEFINGQDQHFNGLIDELAIYNRALSPKEIQQRSKAYYHNTTIRSKNVTLSGNLVWDTFRADRDVPENTYLNISIHDAITNEVLFQDTGNANTVELDLSSIDPMEHGDIYLKAYFGSSQTGTPILYDWGVNWTSLEPPLLLGDIEDIIIVEDTPVDNILNLSHHFYDPLSSIEPPVFTLEYVSDSSNMSVGLNGSQLGIIYLEENWTGNVSVIIKLTNLIGSSVSSNEFTIRVLNVNDVPVWISRPPPIVLDEDEYFLSDYSICDLIIDAESDDITLSVVSSDENISAELNDTSHISVTPRGDYFGISNIGITGWDHNGSDTIDTNITVTVLPVNDLPWAELISPTNGTTQKENNITLSWRGFDIDDDIADLTYRLYFGEDATLDVIQSDIRSDNYTLTDLKVGTKYYWHVLPFDGKDYGPCLNETWSFTIADPSVEVPVVDLISPKDDSIFTERYVALKWNCMNPTEKEVRYKILFGDSEDDLDEIITTSETSFSLFDLAENKTYYWSIVPYAGKLKGVCASGIWSYSINSSFIPVHSLNLSIESEKIELYQGTKTTINITLENTGNVAVLAQFSCRGEIRNRTDLPGNTTVPKGEIIKIPVEISIPMSVEPDAYLLTVVIDYPGISEEFDILVTVKETAVPKPPESPERSVFEMSWFWALIITVLVLVIGGVLFFVFYLRTKEKKETAREGPEAVSAEIEHIPAGGFTRESEVDLIAGNLQDGRPMVPFPLVSPGVSPFEGRLSASATPGELRYILPGDVKGVPELPVTGETKDVKALPQVSAVAPEPSDGGAMTSLPEPTPMLTLPASPHPLTSQTPVVIARPIPGAVPVFVAPQQGSLPLPPAPPVPPPSLAVELFPEAVVYAGTPPFMPPEPVAPSPIPPVPQEETGIKLSHDSIKNASLFRIAEPMPCSICYGEISSGLQASRCSCGNISHLSCGIKIGKCTECGADYESMLNTVSQQAIVESIVDSQKTAKREVEFQVEWDEKGDMMRGLLKQLLNKEITVEEYKMISKDIKESF